MEWIKDVAVETVTLKDILEYKGTPILKYTIEYPEFSSRESRSAVRRMNAYYTMAALDYQKHITTTMMKSAIEDYENSIKNGYPVHEYEAMLVYTLTYNQRCAVSLYTDRYEYTGGAHGATVRTSQTWSIGCGRRILLKNLFPNNRWYISDLKAEISRQIAEQNKNGTGAYFENYAELVDQAFNPNSFYLTPDALAIYFQQYDIAPYSSGIPTFMIPYETVGAKRPYCKR